MTCHYIHSLQFIKKNIYDLQIMKKITILFFCCLILFQSCGNKIEKDIEFKDGSKIISIELNEQKIQDLKTLGLVWGFLKYYHPNIASGNRNWDFELFRMLPNVINSKNNNDRDRYLCKWVNSLGEYKSEKQIKSQKLEIKLSPDLIWISKSDFTDSLTLQLSSIVNAKRSVNNYYVNLAPNVGNPTFDKEAPYSEMIYPDAGYRLLSLYRYWNIIQYYFPYKYLIEEDWKDVLEEFIPKFILAKNETEYQLAILELMARVHDTHANFTDGKLFKYWGINKPAFDIKFIEDNAVVTDYLDVELSKDIGLKIGDEIIAVNGKTVPEIVQDQIKYTPSSNYPTQLRNISKRILRTNDSILTIEYKSDEEIRTEIVKTYIVSEFYDYYNKPKDRPSFKLISENIAYLYLGSIESAGLQKIFNEIANTKGVIIDLRCYPSEFLVFSIGKYLMPEKTEFVKFSNGSIENPGQFTFNKSLEVGEKNNDYYKGKVVILINETTQSQAEYTTMAFRVAPNAIVIGSTTAGADGNVSTIYLPGNIRTMISGIGVYYPDGTETQRIGIVPDIEIKPTIEGIKNNKDELLEKAIELIEE